MKKILLSLIILASSHLALGQLEGNPTRSQIRAGNKAYKEGSYVDAEVAFKKAQEYETQNAVAAFNLGDALYRQERFEDAAKSFGDAAKFAAERNNRAAAFHNQGNAYVLNKDLKKGIESYKNALRLNPNDADTKYNLAYALRLAQQEQSQENPEQEPPPEPSEYAKEVKRQADEMVAKRQYLPAYQLMQEGLRKDETVKAYQDFIGRLGEINGIKPE